MLKQCWPHLWLNLSMQPSENIDHRVAIGKDGLSSLAKTTPYWITGVRWAPWLIFCWGENCFRHPVTTLQCIFPCNRMNHRLSLNLQGCKSYNIIQHQQFQLSTIAICGKTFTIFYHPPILPRCNFKGAHSKYPVSQPPGNIPLKIQRFKNHPGPHWKTQRLPSGNLT